MKMVMLYPGRKSMSFIVDVAVKNVWSDIAAKENQEIKRRRPQRTKQKELR